MGIKNNVEGSYDPSGFSIGDAFKTCFGCQL